MTSTRDRFEPWLSECLRIRYPELEPPLLAAIGAYDSIKRVRQVTPELLEPIVSAASSSRRPLYENASDFLANLTGHFEEARSAVWEMAHHPKSHVRFNAILCVGRTTPPDFVLAVLRHGLVDGSSRVRWKAADWAGRLRLRELVPELEQAVEAETNEKARGTIEFELKLLRDGYIIEEEPDGGYLVTTFVPDGISTMYVSAADLEAKGVEGIIRDRLSSPLYR